MQKMFKVIPNKCREKHPNLKNYYKKPNGNGMTKRI